jgi:hydroxymethylpyrimidine pyrophosphatase-like HAD family hydrolase
MTAAIDGVGVAQRGELVVADLLCDLYEAMDLLLDQLLAGCVLDAYLLAAGAVQIIEDCLERDTLTLRRAAAYVSGGGPAKAPAQALTGIAVLAEQVRAFRGADQRMDRWRDAITKIRDDLAHGVVSGALSEETRRASVAAARRLRAALLRRPNLSPADMLRLPTCFRSFDQQPEDMVRLAEKYAKTFSTRESPIVVLGVRTSGSYLAPLIAATLIRSGFRDVNTLTMRPHRSLWPGDAKKLRSLLQRGAAVGVVDDPPVSGSSVAHVAERLCRRGASAEAITLLIPLFGATPPPQLARYPQTILPFDEWAIHRHIEPEAIRAALSALLNEQIVEVERVRALENGRNRAHVAVLFRARLADEQTRMVAVVGAGLGYFGRHALAVADAVPTHLPQTYGFRDGLVFREWLPEENRIREPDLADVPGLVSYIARRAAAMPATRDRSHDLAGRQPTWEVASRLISLGYGRLGVLLRTILIDPAMRRLCTAPHPAVVDGATELNRWFRVGPSLQKISADLRDFSNSDLYCYDPAFDLAGIDPGSRHTAFVKALRAAYPCSDERFLLYELVHLMARMDANPLVARAAARAVQRYMASQLPARSNHAAKGPLCALDIDGVLESGSMGFPAITPAGMLSLRALAAHGFRPVIATGRCLNEVRERCEAYDLVGGVAEYGALAYERKSGRVVDLVTERDQQLLAQVRHALRCMPDVVLDEDYQHSVRGYRRRGTGLVPLPERTVEAAMAGLGPDRTRLRIIRGERQTDFVARATDKGRGLEVLARVVAESTGTEPGIELAVGDTESDLPMLALARHAYAPANASASVRAAGVTVLRSSYAAGVAAAVGRVLGHPPGRCPTCAIARHTPETRLVLALLAAQESGARGLPRAVLHGMVSLIRAAP